MAAAAVPGLLPQPDLIDHALAAHDAGLCVLPPKEDGSKQPDAASWARYQRERPPRAAVARLYADGRRAGLGVVCGPVSGNLECLEFDCPATFAALLDAARAAGLGGLVERVAAGYEEATPGGGAHWLYRCPEVAGNTALARRPRRPEEMRHDEDRWQVLVETRGAGGYVVVAPSGGRVHPSGRPYALRRGGAATITTITPAERADLWALARAFDESEPREVVPPRAAAGGDLRPGDDFERRADWRSILEPHGWVFLFERGGVWYLRRPGKDAGVSATLNWDGRDRLRVFTTSTAFEPAMYAKFAAHATLEHGGDFAAAARALRAEGYGGTGAGPAGVVASGAAASGAAAGPPEPPAGPRLLITPLSAVQPREVAWLWPRWLARGKVHVCGGHPGDGKSTLLAALAAVLSRGGAWPDGAPSPVGNTLFLLAEDGVDDTLRPRLDLHGADVGRVFALQAVADPDGRHRVFSLERHLDLLREAVAARAVDLVVIDPVTSFMPKADRNAEGDVRDILTPLSQFADETGASVVGIMHVGKPTGSPRRPLQQLLGATAFGAVARVVWMVAELPTEARGEEDDPHAPTPRLLGVVKSNLAVRPAALEWVRPLDGPVAWRGESAHDLGEVLGGGKPAPIEEAKAFLGEALQGGMKTSVGLKQAAKADGISFGTLRRAADALGVERLKQPGVVNGAWMWRLPDGAPRTGSGEQAPEPKALTPEDAQVRAFPPSTEPEQGSAPAGGEGGALRSDAGGGETLPEPGRSEGAHLSTLDGERLPDAVVQETLL